MTNPLAHRPPHEMPFTDHLEELRRRLIYAVIGIVPIFVVALVVSSRVIGVLVQPLLAAQSASGTPEQMQVTGLFEGFNAYMRVAFVLTLIVGLPWIFWQLWAFVAPGLHASERRFAHVLIPMSVVLSVLGVLFMYFVMLPLVMTFFIAFNNAIPGKSTPLVDAPAIPFNVPVVMGDVRTPGPGQVWVNMELQQLRLALPGASGELETWSVPLLKGNPLFRQEFRLREYIETLTGFAIAFVVAFQAPVATLLLGWAGIITPGVMVRYRRQAIMVCTVVGAILTPADPISIFVLAVPLYGLYEFGLVLLRYLTPGRIARGFGLRPEREPRDDAAEGP